MSKILKYMTPGTDSLLYQFDHNTGEIRFSVDFGYGGISIFVIQVSDDKGVEIRDSLLILVDTNTGIDDLSFINSIRYLLCQNYPNPFSTNTTISFIISETSFVSLKVYNILGEEVAILLNKELIAGEHNVVFNAGNLSEGIYLYKLFTGDFIDTKRMLLLR